MARSKNRLDLILVARELAGSRQKAQALIMAGRVRVDDQVVTKPGHLIDPSAPIEVKATETEFVGRGGDKLRAAHVDLGFPIESRICLDAGISTGGFTQYLLNNKAKLVIGIDVGYGQVADPVRRNPRVHLLERTNIRHLTIDAIPARPQLITLDLSFISLTKVIPNVLELAAVEMDLIAMIKPQFEVGREQVEKGGRVRSWPAIARVLKAFYELQTTWGVQLVGASPSRVYGLKKGNTEPFLWFSRGLDRQELPLDLVLDRCRPENLPD